MKSPTKTLWVSETGWEVRVYESGFAVGMVREGRKDLIDPSYHATIDHAIERLMDRSVKRAMLAGSERVSLEGFLAEFRKAGREAQGVATSQIAQRLERIEQKLDARQAGG